MDLTSYYQYPLSMGLGYRVMSPLSDYRSSFDLTDLVADFRLPLPGRPQFQPTLEMGLLQIDARNSEDSRWNHRDVYGLVGLSYSDRLSKTIEVGGNLLAGASLSMYPSLTSDSSVTESQANFEAGVGFDAFLIPAFNIAIEASPTLRYKAALGPLSDFNGFSFGLGLMGHVRLGEDPDSSKAALNSLRLGEVKMPSVFPALQYWYSRNPLATLKIENAERFPLENVEVTFYQKGYMDSPTLCARIPSLSPGASADVGILANFNQDVFSHEGVSPLSGEIAVTYRGKGRAGEQRASVSYDLLDKTAIVWDDDRKVASFITPSDSAIRNYASYIHQTCKDQVIDGYSDEVQFACEVFHALGELGIIYQYDPNQPTTTVRGANLVVDSVDLPRNTLKRATGKCSDLTALYASILESAGIQTAFITVPGHIYAAFNAKTALKAAGDLCGAPDMAIAAGDSLWVPVEITLIGRSSFVDAWRKGMDEWKGCSDADRRFYETAKAQEVYRPVGLRETDLGLQYGRKESVVADSSKDVNALVDAIVVQLESQARKSGLKEDWNRLGIRLARYGRYDKSAEAFRQAAAIDQAYTSPRINLCNVLFLSKKYDKALAEYGRLEGLVAASGNDKSLALLRINISKCYLALGKSDKASEYLGLATKLDPSLTAQYGYLGVPTQGEAGGRAAEAKDDAKKVGFFE
jgi:tetratricopeptide (TPR) repeat protein